MGKSIDDYRAKRDFARTPEPRPQEVSPLEEPGLPRFVVHRHEARRLHYDLRLSMAGVLKCWAVPRGFSYDPKDKRLAVHTEDHPLSYEEFEGVIPKGEYGAGTMTIWDRGRYRVVNPDGLAAIEEGKLEIQLYGEKLRGEWHLVRTKSEKDEWLLFKARDRYARNDEGASPTGLPVDLSSAVHAPFPESVAPMRVGKTSRAFSAAPWIFEMKFRGERVLARKRGDLITLAGEEGVDLAPSVPEVVSDLGQMRAENALLDGVMVALDESQRPDRKRLARRLRGESSEPVFLYVFDLLYYDEWDLRPLGLLERKRALSALLPRLGSVLYVDHVLERGEDLVRAASSAGLPGVIAKEGPSAYQSGPSPAWLEIPVAAGEGARKLRLVEALSRGPGPGSAPAGARKVKFSNLDKVFWPQEGYTKGDLIAYYDQVAEVILPYLRERPMHMNRFPDGIEGKNFYQKDAPDHLPDWIATELIPSDSREEAIRYIICNDRETLLYLANLGSIDLHPWFSRRGSLDSPDWAVLDLDPKEAPFANVVRIARTLGKLLRGIGLRPYLKTSGATGLHIYIPLKPGYTYDHSRLFCEGVATLVASEHRDIATVERVPARRGGRVYIDFLQNRRGQTIVPAYAVRPVPGATVSAPLDWDELSSELSPQEFTIKTVPARLARRGDLFRPALTDLQDLLPAIEAFQQQYKKES
jgi:bifunctional non-homologous end joining protein LigD